MPQPSISGMWDRRAEAVTWERSMKEPIRGDIMHTHATHRRSGDQTPAERLSRAIRDIERKLETVHARNQPLPLSADRARRILRDALARCHERNGIPPSAR